MGHLKKTYQESVRTPVRESELVQAHRQAPANDGKRKEKENADPDVRSCARSSKSSINKSDKGKEL